MASSKPIWQRTWTKLGLSRDLVIAMFKNVLPSTAALLIIQSARINQEFDTVGFLPIVVTILIPPSQPRIPFLRFFIFTLFLQCIALCNTLLAGYCISKARLYTTPPGGQLDTYNSSASAVSGVWLVFSIWVLQVYRTYNPHRAKSMVLCTIFTEVSIVTACRLPDMASIIPFNLQLFEMFLLGYAFSGFTSLFILPQTSRDVTIKDIQKMLDQSQKATSIDDPFGKATVSKLADILHGEGHEQIISLTRTFAKFQIDASDAKKDVGWSQYSPKNFSELVRLFRLFIIPLRGLYSAVAIQQTLHFGINSSDDDSDLSEDPLSQENNKRWEELFAHLKGPMSDLGRITEEGIKHCRISLNLPGSKTLDSPTHNDGKHEDAGSEKATQELPGGTTFITNFRTQIQQQSAKLDTTLGGLLVQDVKSPPLGKSSTVREFPSPAQSRLMYALYVEQLYNGVLETLLQFVLFCDDMHAHSKKRVQLPGKKRFLKFLHRLVDHHHVEGDLEDIASEIPILTPTKSRKPKSSFDKVHGIDIERLSAILNKPSEIVGSSQSFFGFKVACAVMSIAIVGYLHQTQEWFFNRRGIWAAVFIPFSMAPSSGEAKSLLLYRVLGSVASIVISLANWYIADGVPASVIVIYAILIFIQQYFLLKFPQWGSFWRPCIITHSIIVGYSLQAKYSDVPQPPATTTDAFPIYLIGPYRGLCTMIGVVVAYIWTVFPRPTTANMIMRQRLGQALFILAEYYSCMHWAISTWAGNSQGDPNDKSSTAHRLMKDRQRLFVKETALLSVIRDQHKFASFDITFSQKYPERQLVVVADEIDRIMSYLNVVIFVSAHFHARANKTANNSQPQGPWESGVEDLLAACRSTSRQLASLIHILASSVTNDQPLPQFLEAPKPFAVARKMKQLRPDLINVDHVGEEGFKTFAVIEISVAMITKSLDNILTLVKGMVGEVGVAIDIKQE